MMGTSNVTWVWVGVHGSEVLAASNVKGLAEDIGASYSTMKSKAVESDKFSVAVGEMGELKVWLVTKVKVKKVAGRGGKGFIGSR